jgi:hypothetical protein
MTTSVAAAEIPQALSVAIAVVFAAWGAWGLARPFQGASPGEARLATAHRVAAGVALAAAVACLARDVHQQGGMRWDVRWHRDAYVFGIAAVAHGVCRALAGTAWFDGANPRTGVRLAAEAIAWAATVAPVLVIATEHA